MHVIKRASTALGSIAQSASECELADSWAVAIRSWFFRWHLRVKSWANAISIENGNEHGNAAAIYTSHGGHADWLTSRFRAGMLGVNIGVPVPREPFSFGGMYGTKSKYGDIVKI